MRAPSRSEQLVGHQVGGRHDRALGLVAGVDDRVELLEHPVGAVLGAEVVDVQQVDRGQPIEEVEQAAVGLHRLAQQVQQPRQRVDRDRAPGVERRLGDEHRERRLAGADVALDPQAAPGVDVRLDRLHVAAHGANLIRSGPGHVADRRSLEGDAAVALRDPALEARACARRSRSARRRQRAVAGRVRRLVDTKPLPSHSASGQRRHSA